MGVFTRNSPLGEDRPRPAKMSVQRSLTASARRVQISDPKEIEILRKRRTTEIWQEECWEYYDVIGEIKYAFGLTGNIASRVRLYAATPISDDEPPVSLDDTDTVSERLREVSKASLSRLKSAFGGMAGLLHDIAINIQVAGECYLMQTPEKPALAEPERWDIRSVSELLVAQGGQMKIKPSRFATQSQYLDVDKNAFVGRIWRSHPRFSDEADSSMRALRDICDEILLISRTVRSVARSRLNAGALFVPDGLSVSASEEQDAQTLIDGEPIVGADTVDDTDDFEEELVEAMTTPISDEESASAVVPLIIRGPADLGEKIKPIKFERAFDAALTQRSDKLLDRLMQALDVPKDVITGLSNVKYSNAVTIDENLYRSHIEPLILLICDALTAIFLRPCLIAAGFSVDDARKVVVWYDPTEILTRPDRAQDANDGYDRYALSDAAWRRHHGFSESEAPTPDEVARRIMIARGMLSPDVTQGLLELLVPDLMARIRQQSIQNSPAPLSEHAQEVLGGPGGPPTGTPGPAPDATPQPPRSGPPPGPPPGPAQPLPPAPISRAPSPLPKEQVPTP